MFYMTVDACIHCQHCISRMFNTGVIIDIGIGCITSDIVILLPMYSNIALRNKMLEDLKAIWLEYTGCNILEQCYITYNIKCSNYSSYNIYNNAMKNCRKILNEELTRVPYSFMIMINTTRSVFTEGCSNKVINYGKYTFYNIKFPYDKYNESKVKQAIKTEIVNAINYYNMKRMRYDSY